MRHTDNEIHFRTVQVGEFVYEVCFELKLCFLDRGTHNFDAVCRDPAYSSFEGGNTKVDLLRGSGPFGSDAERECSCAFGPRPQRRSKNFGCFDPADREYHSACVSLNGDRDSIDAVQIVDQRRIASGRRSIRLATKLGDDLVWTFKCPCLWAGRLHIYPDP